MADDKRTAAARDAWICFEDEAGQNLRPPKARTWARRGHTPMVTVSSGGSGRISIAGLVCLKAGERTRLVYRMVVYHRRKGEKKGFTESDYAALLDAAHQQLGGNIVLVWDNLNTHVSATMNQLITRRAWLTVFQLPAYAPEINPVEGVWANLKGSLGNLAARSLDALALLVKTRLKRIVYRADLLKGFVEETGLEPP